MSPQLVIGGCAPRPKKLNPLSIKIEAAKLAAEITIRGDIIFGKMDIEGAEYHVLPKMIKDGTIKYINEIYIEWHYKKVNVDEKVHQKLVKQLH